MAKKQPSTPGNFDFMNWPRKYQVGIIASLIVILLAVTLWSNWGGFRYKDKTDYQKQRDAAEAQRQQYETLLANIDVSPKDSQVVMQKIATADVVRQDLSDTLQINQPITVPQIKDSELTFAPRGDQKAVEDYFQKTVTLVQDYNTRAAPAAQTVFTELQDKATIAQAVADTKKLAQNLRQTPVPVDMLQYHKANITTYEQYADFLTTAQSYNSAAHTLLEPRGVSRESWPQVYKDYAIINNRAAVINSELKRVSQKYALDDFRIKLAQAAPAVADPPLLARLGVVKQADAFLGFGDLTITIGDIPELIMYGVRQGLAQAFSSLIINSIDRLVAKIDKYFTITSQLYYSQELGKLYTAQYWKKFNVPEAEQSIMKNFLPNYFCAPQSKADLVKLGEVFAAKSKALLKYDITTIPLNSPDYYNALNDLGQHSAALVDPWSYWKDIYTAQAQPAQMAAADAVNKEITGSGLKSGRDLLNGAISQNVNKILQVQQGSVTEALNLGNSNADNIVSTLVAGVFESLTTKFIFTAVSTGQRGGGLATVAEQPLCISTPKLQPVIPASVSQEDLEAVDQAQVQSCRSLLQLYDSATAQGATDLNQDVANQCRALVAQADAAKKKGSSP
jgi:hypothetical protein